MRGNGTATATPATASHRGQFVGGKSTGSVVGSYDSVTNRGTATFTVTMPTLNNVRNRVITAHYSIGADNFIIRIKLNSTIAAPPNTIEDQSIVASMDIRFILI